MTSGGYKRASERVPISLPYGLGYGRASAGVDQFHERRAHRKQHLQFTVPLLDMVFDPDGTAGDTVAKSFTADLGASNVGLQNYSFLNPDSLG